MPVQRFICPSDKEEILIKQCLSQRGCRLGARCATLPYLRFVSRERDWRGITPSMAGTGPRQMFLRQLCDYAINPHEQAWAVVGQGSHGKLSVGWLTRGIIAEQSFTDEKTKGIPDVLEADEEEFGFYILYDYKVYGSWKAAKSMGIVGKKREVLGKDGQVLYYKSGKKAGRARTKPVFEFDPKKQDIKNETLQLNRYRILVEGEGYPISKMIIQCIPRDAGTYIADSRGIFNKVYLITVPRMPDKKVLDYYANLEQEMRTAFTTGWIRKCNNHETWGGTRCKGYCEVVEQCKEMENGKKFLDVPAGVQQWLSKLDFG